MFNKAATRPRHFVTFFICPFAHLKISRLTKSGEERLCWEKPFTHFHYFTNLLSLFNTLTLYFYPSSSLSLSLTYQKISTPSFTSPTQKQEATAVTPSLTHAHTHTHTHTHTHILSFTYNTISLMTKLKCKHDFPHFLSFHVLVSSHITQLPLHSFSLICYDSQYHIYFIH